MSKLDKISKPSEGSSLEFVLAELEKLDPEDPGYEIDKEILLKAADVTEEEIIEYREQHNVAEPVPMW